MVESDAVRNRTRDRGFSLVELVIAMAVMAIALMALTVSITSASRVNDASRERAIAYELAKAKIEEMRNFTYSGTFDRIFWWYSVQTSSVTLQSKTVLPSVPKGQVYRGDPSLPDPLQLNPIFTNGVEQPIIKVDFPVNAAGQLTELNMTDPVWAAKFGMPKDLNRDGTLGPDLDPLTGKPMLYDPTGTYNAGLSPPTTPPKTAYTILPVRVTVQWQSTGKKPAYVELATLITTK